MLKMNVNEKVIAKNFVKEAIVEGTNIGIFDHIEVETYHFTPTAAEVEQGAEECDIISGITVIFENLKDIRIPVYPNMEDEEDIYMLCQLKAQLGCNWTGFSVLSKGNEYTGMPVMFVATESIHEETKKDFNGNDTKVWVSYLNPKSFDAEYISNDYVVADYVGKAKAARKQLLGR